MPEGVKAGFTQPRDHSLGDLTLNNLEFIDYSSSAALPRRHHGGAVDQLPHHQTLRRLPVPHKRHPLNVSYIIEIDGAKYQLNCHDLMVRLGLVLQCVSKANICSAITGCFSRI